MVGEDLSSTDLHLANGDTLLVGQVAELTQIDPNDVNSASRLHIRKLQVCGSSEGTSGICFRFLDVHDTETRLW